MSERTPIRIRTDKYASPLFVEREVKQNLEVPPDCLQQYPLLAEHCDLTAHADALRWLAYTRKISLHSIAKFQLRLFVDPVLDEVGVIFPILSRDASRVLDMWVRMIDQKKFFRLSREFSGSQTDYHAPNLWFGNHLMTTDRPAVLVEGALDALRLDTLGVQNCHASLGEPSREQISSLYAPAVYLGFDGGGDRAGNRYTKKMLENLQVSAISLLDWGVVGIKDAGDLES
jgi:DNA primase (bacterial type)